MRNPRRVLTAQPDLRARLGLRLRTGLERAARLHRLPAPQAPGRGRPAAAAHGARGRLRPARAMTLRTRIAGRGRPRRRARRDRGRDRRLPGRARRAARRGRLLAPRARRLGRPARRRTPSSRGVPPEPFGGPEGYVQVVRPDGRLAATARRAATSLPLDERARAIARSGQGEELIDTTVDGLHLRVLTRGLGDAGAIQVARPLDEVDRQLDRILLVLIFVGAAGVALGAGLGALVARTALAPIAKFTRRTEELAADPDPSERMEVTGRDELTRLARSFNTTLDSLERSVEAQRHLVADASHELRTPIASLRANIQTLQDADRLPESRARVAARGHRRGAGRADGAGRRHRRAGARLQARRAGRRRAARPDRRRGRRARAGPRRRAGQLPGRRRADGRARRAPAHPASGGEPRRQRRQVEPARRRRGAGADGRRAERARPRARLRGRRTSRTCSSASTAPRARAACRARASGSRSCSRRPRPTAASWTPATRADGGALLRVSFGTPVREPAQPALK